jgi:hypothetical protein
MPAGSKISTTVIFLSGLLMCSAPALAQAANTNDAGANTAQSSNSAATTAGNPATPSRFAHELPFAANEGTMAESASTTALASSTYHQSTGILPGIR